MKNALTLDSSVLVAALRETEEKHKECLLLMKKVKEGNCIAIEPFTILVSLDIELIECARNIVKVKEINELS